MLKTHPPAEQSFLFDGVDWEFYQFLLNRYRDRRVFVTYDRGNLEIMSPSRKQERFKKFLARLIEALTEELNIPVSSGGSETFRRADLDRGLEPDECYWIAHEAQALGEKDTDLPQDPPPDLVIEIEISRRLLDRQSIYAALGVPELWRYDGTTFTVLRLEKDGHYAAVDRSPSFPMLPLDEVRQLLTRRATEAETALIREFRSWVRRSLAAPGESRP